MAGFALDAHCLIAVVKQNAAQDAVRAEVSRRLRASEPMILPAHAVTEAFSILTRLPVRERLTPAQTHAALETNFIARGRVVALEADAYVPVLARLAASIIGGGRVYDEVIAETAVRAGATVLLTLNPKHFPSPPAGLAIIDPTAGFEPAAP